jgi:hypothetical protein
MTCGIYKLNFNNTNKVYIGQSIDIENRFVKHKSAFNRNVATPKLQQAYNNYGMPTLEVIISCDISELNNTEKEAIEIFDSVNNGFNTLYESGNPVLFGDKAGGSKYTNEQYISVLRLLVSSNPTLSKREIQEITGISLYTIRHIAALESHTWLKQLCPDEYIELERIKTQKKYYRGNQYPKLISPEGIVYEVTHVTNFAKEHGLLQPKVTEVLKGTRNHHKGWVRAA